MKTYIRSAACISPQKTLHQVGLLTDPVEYNDTRLRAVEPDYSDYLDPKLTRRMSHVTKWVLQRLWNVYGREK
jgi:3-oxoacyl-[acyl-carrier-protein] synthase II